MLALPSVIVRDGLTLYGLCASAFGGRGCFTILELEVKLQKMDGNEDVFFHNRANDSFS